MLALFANKTSVKTFVFGYSVCNKSILRQCVVHTLLSNKPASPNTKAALHTEQIFIFLFEQPASHFKNTFSDDICLSKLSKCMPGINIKSPSLSFAFL